MGKISFIQPDLKCLEDLPEATLVLFRFAEMEPLSGIVSLVDWRLYGHLSNLIINGFLSGDREETLLMPLGRHLPQEYLLLFGLGERSLFGEREFLREARRAFDAVRGLNREHMVLALPGRVEGECDTAEAIEWFLSCYEEHGGGQDIHIIEPVGAQKAMTPVVERWRLKQLVP